MNRFNTNSARKQMWLLGEAASVLSGETLGSPIVPSALGEGLCPKSHPMSPCERPFPKALPWYHNATTKQ